MHNPLPGLVILLLLAPLPLLGSATARAEDDPVPVPAPVPVPVPVPVPAPAPAVDVTKLLADENWEKRVEGLAQLSAREGDPAAALLALPLLDDADWEVQIRAAEALGRIGTDEALRPLVLKTVHGEIAWIREAATAALEGRDDGAAATLLAKRARVERGTLLRSRAVEALGRTAEPEMLRLLRPWLSRKEPELVAAAARAVGSIARRHPGVADDALELLRRLLLKRDDRRYFSAFAAALDAIGGMDTPQARQILVREVLRQPATDAYILRRVARHLSGMRPEWVQSAILDAVPRAEDPAEIAVLARLAGASRCAPLLSFLRGLVHASKDEGVRVAAAHAMGLLDDAEAVPDLRRLLEDGASHVRVEAVIALARLLEPTAFRALWEQGQTQEDPEVRLQFIVGMNDHEDPAAIPVLASFVRDDDWRVASAAIATIGTLGIARDMPLIEPHLRHRDWKIRAAAYEALGRLRAAKAIPRLAAGLADDDPVVRGVCHANLQILSREKFGPVPKTWRAWFEEHGADLVLQKRSRMTDEERETEEAERARTRYAHEKYRFRRRRGVEILQKARIIVVTGAWDHVEVVLDHLEIPYTLLRAQELKAAGLNPNQVVLVNCEGSVDKGSQERLRWFVNIGGYLMSTDWALTKTIEPCFPGYMAQYQGANTGNDVVEVQDASPGHSFTEGVFDGVPALQWWLEIRAFPITVVRPTRCRVLVDSAQMRERYGSSPCATVFRWGLGKVQHSISHFQLQEEGMQQVSRPRERMVFAADHLGLSLEQIRHLAQSGAFERQLNEEAMREIAPDYSMFRLIVNVVKEKEEWVENL